jgi:hypothetical protein
MRIVPPDFRSEEECVKAFVPHLRSLIRERDFFGILKVVSPLIDLDRFDSVIGKDNFTLEYEHNQKDLWEIMEFCLSYPGAPRNGGGCIHPYIHAPMHSEYISASSLVATGDSTPVFSGPSLKSEVVVRLSYDVVTSRGVYLDEDFEISTSQGAEFHKLILPDGSEGFGRRADFLSPLDPYIVISTRGGECLLDAIVPSAIGPTFDHY